MLLFSTTFASSRVAFCLFSVFSRRRLRSAITVFRFNPQSLTRRSLVKFATPRDSEQAPRQAGRRAVRQAGN